MAMRGMVLLNFISVAVIATAPPPDSARATPQVRGSKRPNPPWWSCAFMTRRYIVTNDLAVVDLGRLTSEG